MFVFVFEVSYFLYIVLPLHYTQCSEPQTKIQPSIVYYLPFSEFGSCSVIRNIDIDLGSILSILAILYRSYINKIVKGKSQACDMKILRKIEEVMKKTK